MSKPDTRWRLLRDVLVFQVKAALEAVLDVTLIPLSLFAAGADLLLGNWQSPRWFHAVLRFGERCETRINLWGVAPPGAGTPQPEVDAVMRSIEALVRQPGIAPDKVRELRRWAAAKLAPADDGRMPSPERPSDPAG